MVNKDSANYTKQGLRASAVSIAVTFLLIVIKLIAGLLGNSQAMISDAANSISDLITYTLILTAISAATKRPDANHPYGHEKLESIVALLLAVAIAATGVAIGYRSIRLLFHAEEVLLPSQLALAGATLSIGIKILLFLYVKALARKSQLSSIKALAADHFADIFASLGALIGIIGSRLGLIWFDLVASILIALLILKSAVDIFRHAADVLLDGSVDAETVAALEETILNTSQVQGIDLLRTRTTGPRFFVEVEICCAKELSLASAHAVAQEVHDKIEQQFARVQHVMVHVNPVDEC